ncbi:MAG TPA: hypothetical protein VJV23_15700 [Candidatus Polarisedimenticolia bacterium]|nr:hypothetical protein [Candidatus Polarisedimenticolia bacterium]
MRRSRIAAVLLPATLLSSGGTLARTPPVQAPLETLLPWAPGEGAWELSFSTRWSDDARPAFFTASRRDARAHLEGPAVDLSYGVGRSGEVRLRAGAQAIWPAEADPAWGPSDTRLSFSQQLARGRVAASAGFEVKLPNASRDDLLGTDETDVALIAAAGGLGPGGGWGWAAHAGLLLAGNPRPEGGQDDLLAFGAALWRSAGTGGGRRVTLMGEVAGTAASRFGNDARRARAGLIWSGRLPIHVVAGRGLTSASEDWSVQAGVTVLGPRGAAHPEPSP